MKKLISLLLGLALLAAVSVPVLADDAQTAFDPHVTVNTTSSRITVTVNDIPAGQTPSLTVDCSFSSASVTGPDGAIDKGKVTLAEGKITFPVAKGGTYTITNTAPSSSSSGPSVASYDITVSDTANGTVKPDRGNVGAGTRVTVTVTPDQGYKLDKLTASDKNGKDVALTQGDDGTYTFVMPNSKVTLSAAFVTDESTQPTPPAPAAPKFVDVADDAYYAPAVDWAVEQGITSGVDRTHFAPDASCTRDQMVTFLWRAAGKPTPATAENPFTDVKDDAYYHDAVLWAVEKGITLGTSKTTFSPDATVTRGQSVTFLYRFTGEKADGVCPFTDVMTSDYFYDPVVWASVNEITAGKSATSFAPKDDCTRGQIVTFLYRAMGKA